MLRRLIQAGAIVALFAGPAAAQDSRVGIPLNPKVPPSQEEIDKRKAADRAYDAAMQKIPDKKASTDPWGNVRPAAPTPSKKQQ